MPAVLTHKAIMLMARERLAEIIDVVSGAMDARRAAGQPVRNLETRLLALAREARRQMSTQPHSDGSLPGQLFARPVDDKVSRFAVMGAMGPDITAFSAILAPGQAWVFDTVHKGTPDHDREMVRAGTCDLALEIWAEASRRLSVPARLDEARAYVLGHLCHVAADVISHPFTNDIEWHDGTETRVKLSHAEAEGSHDAHVARVFYTRDSTRDGPSWGKWWPESGDVAPELFAAYEQALENIYELRSGRPRGFGEFERRFSELEPPGLDTAFISDGYSLYRSGIINIGYGFGFWSWFGMLSFLVLPGMFAPLLIHALPHGRQLFSEPDDPAQKDDDRKWFEVLALPLYTGAIDALIYGGWIASLTRRGVKGRTIAGLVASAIITLGLIGFAVENHAEDMSKEARWPLFFALPAGIATAFLITGIADFASEGKERRGAVPALHALPLLQLLILAICLFFVFYVALGGMDVGLDSPVFWVLFVFWILFCTVLWVVFSFKARDAKIPEHAERFSAQRPHGVRLFDDATLFRDPVLQALGRESRFLPSGRRPILRLWWAGSGTMEVRSDRYGLAFRRDGGAVQVVPGPVAPMTPHEYLGFLNATVTDGDGSTGHLMGTLVFADEEERYELPPGATFAAHGDTEKTQAGRREKSAEFRQLGGDADSDYILYHAPKTMQGVRFGADGPFPAPFDFDEADLVTREAQAGYSYPHDQGEGRSSDTLMSYAADLAALLCMGAASHMADPALGLNKCYQVFRNWNLDRRRVNEWRMLVSGGALSEKRGNAFDYDPAMPRGRSAPADPDAWVAPIGDPAQGGSPVAARQAERAMLEQGWIPLLRKWLAVERGGGEDLLDGSATLFPGWPDHLSLSRGLAFLLDLPEPG